MQVQAEVSGPSGPVQVEFDPREGKGQFTAREHGMHEVLVTNEGEAVKVDIYNIYRVFSKGRNEVGPSKSLIFWTFSDVLGFFRSLNMGDFSFWYFLDK